MHITFDGNEAFLELVQALQQAKKRIWICMYMIRFDERIKELWRILEEKHEEGLDVIVYYDALGCARNFWRLSTMPFTQVYLPQWWRLGSRNHVKLVIIDDEKAIVSGRNWTKKYFGEWVDTSIHLDAKTDVQDILRFSKYIEQKKPKPLSSNSRLRYTNPLLGKRNVYHFILEQIVLAKKEIQIASPYFVIDDAIEELLRGAMERGVHVTVIIPKKPEHRMAATFNRINFQRIHHKNLTVMRSAGMFHSKVMLFDETVLLGSANFDNRSFKHNMELSVVLGDAHLIAVRKHLKEVANHSIKYNWIQRTYDHFLYHLTRHLMEFL